MNAPTFDGKYVCILHPSVAFDLRQDEAWIAAHQYAAATELFSGEIGELHGVRFVETTEAKIFRGEDLAQNGRTLLVNGKVENNAVVAFDGGTVAAGALAGVGLCTRPGLDCEQGKWAINTGPRRMIAENLHHAGLDAGCWLLEIGVENGEELAKHTLNPLLGVVGGISILGTTGLVRPYSHEAYIETVRICVKSHHIPHGTTMVFCTGGRTKSGAERRLPSLPETAGSA